MVKTTVQAAGAREAMVTAAAAPDSPAVDGAARTRGVAGLDGLDSPGLAALRERLTPANAQPLRRDGASYVLVWVQQALREAANPLVEAGVAAANALGLPLVVYHGLREDYPHASARLHRFVLGASREMAQDLAARGIRCVQHVDRDGRRERGLVHRLATHAALVLTDEQFAFVAREHAARLAARADVAVVRVDAARLVPTRLLPPALGTVRGFRTRHAALRDGPWAGPLPRLEPAVAMHRGALPFEPDDLGAMDDAALDALVAGLRIDQRLPASAEHPPTRSEVAVRLARLRDGVGSYAATRGNPAIEHGTTQLSPHLHFGVVGPHEVAAAVAASDAGAPERSKFLDEFLTWREWSHYRAREVPDLHRHGSMARASRDTLQAHAGDPRPDLRSIDDVTHGRTGDAVFDAAQRQWLATGWMHNALRMVWATQLLRLTPDPRTAWALGAHLNDRLSLDGRDPATYLNLHWMFGYGSFPRDKPIYGYVMRRNASALLSRPGMRGWVDAMLARPMPSLEPASPAALLAQYG